MRTREAVRIDNLSREVNILHSFVIGIAGKDSEGGYRPEFVKNVLKASSNVVGKFNSANDFLAKLKTAK